MASLDKVVALVLVAALIVIGGVLGFEFIMKLQMWITVITAVLTVIYVILVASNINFATLAALPAGPIPQLIGGFVFMMTGFGLGWVNAAGDYSRYLPRHASSAGVVGWTTFGASLGPVLLLIIGLMLAGSSQELSEAVATDPDRRADHLASDLVPGPVRTGRGARSGRWRCPRHLLLWPRAPERRPAGASIRRSSYRRRLDDRRIHLSGVHRGHLHRAVPGILDHFGRPDRGLVRHLPRRLRSAPPARTRARSCWILMAATAASVSHPWC